MNWPLYLIVYTLLVFCLLYIILVFVQEKAKSYNDNFEGDENGDFKKYAFKLLFHENTLFTSRVNLLLVAESLLAISYVTSLTSEFAIQNEIDKHIIYIGIILTSLFGIVNIRSSRNFKKK